MCPFDYSNCLFLLGGHDLEMNTIRDLLSANQVPYADKNLRWNNAKLSEYVDEIQEFLAKHPAGQIFGIELTNDLPFPLPSYQPIDHHNEFSDRPSALEQVLRLLNLPMEHRHKLIAANDSHYITGMQAIGATPEDIAAIRWEDRKAQGVSEEDERLAELAIAQNLKCYGSLLMVQAYSSSFSPICDRLYPYSSLLIYTEDEWTFYGKGAKNVLELLKADYQQGKLYYGGGDSGYVGSRQGIYTKYDVHRLVKQIKCMNMNSYHIFYFPFRWSLKGDENIRFSEQVDLTRIEKLATSQWKRVQLDEQMVPDEGTKEADDACMVFNERQYFFDFVHPVLYDDKKRGQAPLIHHYERCEPQGKERVDYIIEIGDKENKREYVLRVDAINLNLYSTGVGILSFYLANENEGQQHEFAIREINQFGRRIMPPNCYEFKSRSLLAASITIQGLAGDQDRYKDTFDYKIRPEKDSTEKIPQRGLSSVWEPALFIRHLIEDLSPALEVVPVIDDRMLVNCWYGNNELAQQVANNAKTGRDSFVMGDFWYKYVFVDEGKDDYCQNDRMKEQLLGKSTYFRWQGWGTLYGISRYSFVALTNKSDFAKNVLAVHMRTIYARLFELVIIQRASMLRFSGEVTKVSGLADTKEKEKEVADRINSLYKEYIRFINQIYFRNVTAQDQGIELYEMLIAQFDSNAQIKDLDGEISELYQYITLQVDQKRNENGEWLNKLATIFLPATLLTGLFGMNRYCQLETELDFWCHFALIGVVIYVAWRFIKHKWKR